MVYFIKIAARPTVWICGANFGTTYNENLVGIALVVLIIQKFEYFAHLA